MQATSERKTDTVNCQCQHCQNTKLEGEIEILKHVLNGLCIRELNNGGRAFVNKLIKQKQHELTNLNEPIDRSRG
jgi:hypothetical protein